LPLSSNSQRQFNFNLANISRALATNSGLFFNRGKTAILIGANLGANFKTILTPSASSSS